MSTSPTNPGTAPATHTATTDVAEFIAELDGGHFDRMASVALSNTAAGVVDHERKGKVTITLVFEPVKGTAQVRVSHITKFEKPTMSGTAWEEARGATVMHVGRAGKLSLAQPSLLEKQQQSPLPG